MKKVILILLIAAFSRSAICQDEHGVVPKQVSGSFAAKYPGAHVKNWKFKDGNYIAEFIAENKKYFAYYSNTANWLRTESKVRWTHDLPSEIRDAFFKSKYKSWHIDNMKKIEMPSGEMFTIHVDDGDSLDSDHYDIFKKDIRLYFTTTGELEKKLALN